jgi:hypothetical protein
MKCYGFFMIAYLEKCCSLVHGTGECVADLAKLITEVQTALSVPIRGLIDFRAAFHSKGCSLSFARDTSSTLSLSRASREAAKPIYEADRHAKKELKKHVRGVRPIERAVEKGNDDEAAIRSSGCLSKANASGKSTWSLTIVCQLGADSRAGARFILEFGDFGISILFPSPFTTARAGSRYMVRRQEGVILLAAVPARGAPNYTAIGSALGTMESLLRCLAADLGLAGVWVVGIRSGGSVDTRTIQQAFENTAHTQGI